MSEKTKGVWYQDKWFKYFPSAKRGGKSIITGNKFPAGTAIFYNFETFAEFTEEEWDELRKNSPQTPKYHTGALNKEFTEDDSHSRIIAKQIFKKHYGIELHDSPSLYLKETDELIEFTNSKFCIDLVGYRNPENKQKMVLVEVERTKMDCWFSETNTDVTVLAAKYWKYFYDGNPNHESYLIYINENIRKVMVIKGSDIKFNRGDYVAVETKCGLKEYYSISKKFVKIFDIPSDPENILETCMVTYVPKGENL